MMKKMPRRDKEGIHSPQALAEIMKKHDQNKSVVAEELGIPRSTLYNWLKADEDEPSSKNIPKPGEKPKKKQPKKSSEPKRKTVKKEIPKVVLTHAHITKHVREIAENQEKLIGTVEPHVAQWLERCDPDGNKKMFRVANDTINFVVGYLRSIGVEIEQGYKGR